MNGLLHLPQATGKNCNHKLPIIPDVEISTSPPMLKLAVGTAVNLTCMAQPRSIDAGYYDRWTEYIQWYDPQGKPVGHKCVQGRTMVLKLRCTLMLKNLTVEKLGNYTCEAGNPYPAHCRRKSVEIGPQDTKPNQSVRDLENQITPISFSLNFICTTSGYHNTSNSPTKDSDPYSKQSNRIAKLKLLVLDHKYHCIGGTSAGGNMFERLSNTSTISLKVNF